MAIRKQSIGGIIVLLLMSILVTSCVQDNNQGVIQNEPEGLLIIKLRGTGLNESFEQVVLEVSDVDLESTNTNITSWNFNNWFGIIGLENLVYFEPNQTQAQFLVAEELNPESFTAITIEIDDATAFRNGEEINLNIVNDEVRIDRDFQVNSNEATTITLELDLRNMISENQGGGFDIEFNITEINWFDE